MRVAPVGELDIATVYKLESEVARLLESGFARIVLDLRGLSFIDSTGLCLVLRLAARSDACLAIRPDRGSHCPADRRRGAPSRVFRSRGGRKAA